MAPQTVFTSISPRSKKNLDLKYGLDMSSCPSSSSSEDELYHEVPMQIRPTELLGLANRRQGLLFKTKEDLRRIVLTDTLIDRLEIHLKKCEMIRINRKINRKRRSDERDSEVVKKVKFGVKENKTKDEENSVVLKRRLGQMDLSAILGARQC